MGEMEWVETDDKFWQVEARPRNQEAPKRYFRRNDLAIQEALRLLIMNKLKRWMEKLALGGMRGLILDVLSFPGSRRYQADN